MPQLIVKLGESTIQKYAFDKPMVTIGRALENDVVLENLSVSRRHSQIELIGNQYYINDLESANGTYINGVRVLKHVLKNDDIITIGKHKIYFIADIKKEEESIPENPFDFEKTVVVKDQQPCFLVVIQGKPLNQSYKITKTEFYIGRDMDCDVVIHDWLAAKKHAQIKLEKNNYVLTDMGTWKGTKVNGQAMKERILLNKDEIEIGSTKLKFLMEEEDIKFQAPPKLPPLELLPKSISVEKVKAGEKGPFVVGDSPVISSNPSVPGEYVASMYSPKFHFTSCNWAKGIHDDNRIYFKTVGDAILSRRRSCGSCKPGMEDKDVEFWLRMLKDDDLSVRDYASQTLKKLTGKEYA